MLMLTLFRYVCGSCTLIIFLNKNIRPKPNNLLTGFAILKHRFHFKILLDQQICTVIRPKYVQNGLKYAILTIWSSSQTLQMPCKSIYILKEFQNY